MVRKPLFVFACALLVALESFQATAAAERARGLRFDSPGVLDLAQRSTKASGDAAAVVALADADAAAIFAAPAIGEDPPALAFSEDVFGCGEKGPRCLAEHEKALIAASDGRVARAGKRLVAGGAEFVDWSEAATKSADGDAETHWYLGRLDGSGYLRIEVQFGHDAPGNFLVNARTGKVAFVHNGADLVAPSPDGGRLLTWNALNPPLSLRVAALDAAGPRIVLACAAVEGNERLTPVFKGWHDSSAFDLVVEIGEQGKSMARLALRISGQGGRWQVAASDEARLARIGLHCWSAENS